MVVTNAGSEMMTIDSVKISGLAMPYNSLYYNKAETTFYKIIRPLEADFKITSRHQKDISC